MTAIEWGMVYRTLRDLIITGTVLVLLVVEVTHDARTEVLLLIASILGVPTYLRSSAAIKNATNGAK